MDLLLHLEAVMWWSGGDVVEQRRVVVVVVMVLHFSGVSTTRCFTHVSITTPIVSALKNYYRYSFLEAPTDILKPLDPGDRFTSETAARRFQK
jgi:hypothetical protein